ncbi:DUF427 domain-containing protein [Dactylosporangium vinaceum]|uniref:DUF427 domain-containing protein n=2 Tax=Dactylosporangium vinaceum TaxID=53362 RepID=A0ABV5MC14_9ACTN|nr:DUF427 domain-containing protein [Dactylosporangium vinaceum]UAB92038.1 DUF427 domain-containing protein [Dactylosporangium vinaceum]
MMQRPTESVWDYPRPPRAEPTDRHITASHRGEVVFDSRGAVRVLETSHPPVYYIPRADVRAVLTATRRRTFCEFKGYASYWNLVVGGVVVPDAAWSYEDPTPGYEILRSRLAFYPGLLDECAVDGERVVPQPGDFYGGWLTADITGPFKGGPGTQGW